MLEIIASGDIVVISVIVLLVLWLTAMVWWPVKKRQQIRLTIKQAGYVAARDLYFSPGQCMLPTRQCQIEGIAILDISPDDPIYVESICLVCPGYEKVYLGFFLNHDSKTRSVAIVMPEDTSISHRDKYKVLQILGRQNGKKFTYDVIWPDE